MDVTVENGLVRDLSIVDANIKAFDRLVTARNLIPQLIKKTIYRPPLRSGEVKIGGSMSPRNDEGME